MIFASSGSEQGRESGHSTGSKIFAVVKVAEVYDPASGVKERLLMIKDLSEKLDWTGDWSHASPKWSPELREHLGFNQTYREGSYTFYMSFDDYVSYYNSTGIVRLHHSPHSKQLVPYTRETLRLSHGKDSFALAKFYVPQQTERVYITIHQVSTHLANKGSKYKISKCRIIVGLVHSAINLEYVKAVNSTEEDLVLEMPGLSVGNYIVFLQLDWNDPSHITSFIFSSFSDQNLNLEAADKTEYQAPPVQMS